MESVNVHRQFLRIWVRPKLSFVTKQNNRHIRYCYVTFTLLVTFQEVAGAIAATCGLLDLRMQLHHKGMCYSAGAGVVPGSV